VTLPRIRPPRGADERTQLIGWLDAQRGIAAWKCEGLSEADAHRSVLPTSPYMTMAGIVSHLRWAENLWFEIIFLNRPSESPVFNGPEDADMMVDGIPLGQLLEDYERQCATANEIIAAHSLDDVGQYPEYQATETTLRWIMLHMLEETARHAGHMDTIRELLDGQKGYF
jgi:Protein of unknown function (DUF664)